MKNAQRISPHIWDGNDRELNELYTMIQSTDHSISSKIFEIRGTKIILDETLAEIYEVKTKELNQAVKRNFKKFPDEFMFELTEDEWHSLRSQFVTLKNARGSHRKYLPKVFTEYGVVMLASVLNSERAIAMNIAVIRAFISLRHLQNEQSYLHEKITELENKFDEKFNSIEQALEFILQQKQNDESKENRKMIGFKAMKK